MATAGFAEGVMAAPGRKLGGVTVPVPPSTWVACSTLDCRRFGQQHQIWLRRVGIGVVEIPRLRCESCGCELLMSLWGDEMPKIHADRDPTYKADITTEPPQTKAATRAQTRDVPKVSVPFPDELISGGPFVIGEDGAVETAHAQRQHEELSGVDGDAAPAKKAPRKAGGRKK